MKILEHIFMVIIGIIAGFFYMIFSYLILIVCYSYSGDYGDIFADIYKYYLPLMILFTSIVFNQYKAFIIILVTTTTEVYMYYLWEKAWDNINWMLI